MHPEFNQLLQCLSDDLVARQCEYVNSLAKQSQNDLIKHEEVFAIRQAVEISELQSAIELLQRIAGEYYELQQINQITSQN